ncbi:MAG: hypothetical protein JWM68_662 [Verrucomicrobiales bacterium]|nr:hypothetical protein [Verrucomicrobiales bacterium]
MIALPPINLLINRCRALSALDLILSPEWQYRFYSFNAHWSDQEQMASMRDGCGNEWWIVFHREGWSALKGLGHESSAWSEHGEKISAALQQSFPPAFKEFSTEPAFRWNETSFAYFHAVGGGGWTRVNDLAGYPTDETGEKELLEHLVGSPSDYAQFASDYYETEVDPRVVAQVFALHPITPQIITSLNSSTLLKDIVDELQNEIGYPRAKGA